MAAVHGNNNTFYEPLDTLPVMPSSGRVPGVNGIMNHGNTCYMNAVIQARDLRTVDLAQNVPFSWSGPKR